MGQPLKVNGHGERRELVIGDFSACVSLNQSFDLRFCECSTIPFPRDQLSNIHRAVVLGKVSPWGISSIPVGCDSSK